MTGMSVNNTGDRQDVADDAPTWADMAVAAVLLVLCALSAQSPAAPILAAAFDPTFAVP